MPRSKLDSIDRKILADLQNQGRMTNVELAERAGISAPPCLRRLRALEEEGIIIGYHAEVNPDALDFKITAFVHVKLSSNNDGDLRAFEDVVRAHPLIRECHLLVGDFDFMLRVVAKTWDDYQKFISGDLTSAPHVAQIKSSLAVRRSKFAPGVPIDETQ